MDLNHAAGTLFALSGDSLFQARQVSHAQWGALGEVLFKSFFAPKDFQDSRRWRVQPQQLVQGYPSHQVTGEDERTGRMTIELHNEFTDLTRAHIDLSDLAEKQIPRGLVVGTETLGMFTVREMPRTILETLPNGTIIAVNYQLTLVEVRNEEAGR